jgi:hypothetical protein
MSDIEMIQEAFTAALAERFRALLPTTNDAAFRAAAAKALDETLAEFGLDHRGNLTHRHP